MPTELQLRHAAYTVAYGGIIAYPTEAVFGLGCNPWHQRAVARILALKGRTLAKGLVLIANNVAQLKSVVAIWPNDIKQEIFASWPGPVTWVLPAHPEVPEWLTGGSGKIAVRVTAHPVAAALCRVWGGPLVSTSANRSGQPAIRKRLPLRRQFYHLVDYLVPGDCGLAQRPSKIIDATTGNILRN